MSDRLLLAGLFFRMTLFVGEGWWWWGTTTWTGEVSTLVERFLAGGACPARRRQRFALSPARRSTDTGENRSSARLGVATLPGSLGNGFGSWLFQNFSNKLASSFLPRNNVRQVGSKGRDQVSAKLFGHGQKTFFHQRHRHSAGKRTQSTRAKLSHWSVECWWLMSLSNLEIKMSIHFGISTSGSNSNQIYFLGNISLISFAKEWWCSWFWHVLVGDDKYGDWIDWFLAYCSMRCRKCKVRLVQPRLRNGTNWPVSFWRDTEADSMRDFTMQSHWRLINLR